VNIDFSFFLGLLGLVIVIFTLPGSVELLFLTLGAMLPKRTGNDMKEAPKSNLKLAIIIPAHNEEINIKETIASIKECSGEFTIVVVADNCTDDTALISSQCGVRVLTRRDPTKIGKGYALDYAFSTLLKEGFDLFLIVDADTLVEKNLVSEVVLAFEQGADALQTLHTIINPTRSLKMRLLNIAFLAFNYLRPESRMRWGISTGISGNGFALNRPTLLNVPYTITSIVEDTAYHLRLVSKGYKVIFIDSTKVLAESPPSTAGILNQRSRWEGGRLRLLLDEAPLLLKQILKGNFLLIEPLLDLLLLPLSYHALLLLLLLAIPFSIIRLYALTGLGIILVHLLMAIKLGRGGMRDVLALAFSPFYLLWKIFALQSILKAAQKKWKWIRSERAKNDKR